MSTLVWPEINTVKEMITLADTLIVAADYYNKHIWTSGKKKDNNGSYLAMIMKHGVQIDVAYEEYEITEDFEEGTTFRYEIGNDVYEHVEMDGECVSIIRNFLLYVYNDQKRKYKLR